MFDDNYEEIEDRIKEGLKAADGEADYIALMKLAVELDQEYAHLEADHILCTLLKQLGFVNLIEVYDSIDKRYA